MWIVQNWFLPGTLVSFISYNSLATTTICNMAEKVTINIIPNSKAEKNKPTPCNSKSINIATKWCEKSWIWLKPWLVGTSRIASEEEISDEYQHVRVLDCFQTFQGSYILYKRSRSIVLLYRIACLLAELFVCKIIHSIHITLWNKINQTIKVQLKVRSKQWS